MSKGRSMSRASDFDRSIERMEAFARVAIRRSGHHAGLLEDLLGATRWHVAGPSRRTATIWLRHALATFEAIASAECVEVAMRQFSRTPPRLAAAPVLVAVAGGVEHALPPVIAEEVSRLMRAAGVSLGGEMQIKVGRRPEGRRHDAARLAA